MTGAIFLDRDGVINKKAPPHQYVTAREQFEFIPGVLDALAFLNKNSERKIVVVTNQACIGNGLVPLQQVRDLNTWMIERVEEAGGRIDHVFFCTHRSDEDCDCRKPKPGMLLWGEKWCNVDLSHSCLVGDTGTDIQAAHAAGVYECYPVSAAWTLRDVAPLIVRQEQRGH